MSEEIKIPEKKESNQEFLRNIEFVVDTVPNTSELAGYYMHQDNSLTVTHKSGKTNMDCISHEHKHKDNFNAGIYSYAMSFEQMYKLNMHDEISANMAELIGLRDKYLKTRDISVFDNYIDKSDKRYDFYKQAIINGDIKPGSPYKEDFDKEMKLIVNGTKKMWMEDFAETEYYVKQNTKTANLYSDDNAYNEKYYNQNYKIALKQVYTMGGVDFSEYLDKDIEIPKEVRDLFISKNIIKDVKNTSNKKSILSDKPIKSVDSFYEIVNGKIQINKTPVYRKWQNKDGFRVSTPQTTTILDLTKDCIQKPTKSYAKEKNFAQDSENKLKNAIKRRKENTKEKTSQKTSKLTLAKYFHKNNQTSY